MNIAYDPLMLPGLPPCGGQANRITGGKASTGRSLCRPERCQLIPLEDLYGGDVRSGRNPGSGDRGQAPAAAYRGAILDAARHFFTVDEVKTMIDILALLNERFSTGI